MNGQVYLVLTDILQTSRDVFFNRQKYKYRLDLLMKNCVGIFKIFCADIMKV